MQEDYWRNNFNTILTKPNEKRFQAWIRGGKKKYGVDLSKDLDSYDLRGFWKSGGYKDEAFRKREGHAPDTYKKPNHPTFSEESIYSGQPGPLGVRFFGGKWLSESEFKPSKEMLSFTHPLDWYKDYMKKEGEGVKLVLD